MYLNTSIFRSQPPLVQLGILVVSLIPLYLISYHYRSQLVFGGGQKRHNAYPPSSPDFEKKWVDTQLISPFYPWSLQRYCNQTTWRPTLGFHLPNANGGIGNIKGNFLDFIFFAIEAGATKLVLPSMTARDDSNLIDVWHGRQSFDTFFNQTWFHEAMGQACPQIEIVPETPNIDAPAMEGLVPEIYVTRFRRQDRNLDNTREHFNLELEEWVKAKTGKEIGEQKVIVSIERTLWQHDTFGLPWNVRRELGQVLRFRNDIREFAAEIIKNMGLEYGLDIDASEPVHEGAFFGAHLRVEKDAIDGFLAMEGDTDYATQTKALIEHAVKRKLSTLYVATGSIPDLKTFRQECSENRPPLNVTSKFDLLSAGSAAALRKLTWDQQALVDMEVLLRSSFFMGISRSSFSDQVCMTRNQYFMDMGRVMEPYAVEWEERNSAFDDGYSRVTGFDAWAGITKRGMWP